MKKIILSLSLFAGLSLATATAQDKAETVKNLLSGISIDKLSSADPIASFNEWAKKSAAKVVVLTKDNAAATLKEAASYKHCVITVSNHTIVKVPDLKNCRTSGSWGTCMPFGEGYIQSNGLTSMKDYINNIIGRPDDQVRTLYLFN